MSCTEMVDGLAQVPWQTSFASTGSETDSGISGWGSRVSEVTENTPLSANTCQPWDSFQETPPLDQIQSSRWSSSKDAKQTDGPPTAKRAAKVADDREKTWEEQQAQIARLEARRKSREQRPRPWLHNSKLCPPPPKGLLEKFEALAISALEVVTVEVEKPGDSFSGHTSLAKGSSLSVDTLDYLHPERVSESLNFLEEVLASLNVIGRLCRVSLTTKEDRLPDVPLCKGLGVDEPNTDASGFGLVVQIGDNLLESYGRICSAAGSGNENWRDNLCLIYKLLGGEELPGVAKLVGHQLSRHHGSQYLDQIRTDKEFWVGRTIDYDFLKDFSWSLVQLLKDTYTIMRLCDPPNFSVAAREEFDILKELTKTYLAEMEILYAADVTEKQGSIVASSGNNDMPDMRCSALVKSIRRCDFSKTRREIAREVPHLLNLVDTKTGQIETVEMASLLSMRLLTRLYKHFESAVRGFLNVTSGCEQTWRDIHIKARYLRREQAFVPPDVRRALDLTICYRQAATLAFEGPSGYDFFDGHIPYTRQLCEARKEINGIKEDNEKFGRLSRQRRSPLNGPFNHSRESKFDRVQSLCFGPAISDVIAARQERFRTMLHSLDQDSTHLHYCPPLKALHDWLSVTKEVPESVNSLVDKYLVPLVHFLPHDIFFGNVENAIDGRARLNYASRSKCCCRPPSPTPDPYAW